MNWVCAVFRGDSIFGKMTATLRALWFCATALLLLLLRFVQERVFRYAERRNMVSFPWFRLGSDSSAIARIRGDDEREKDGFFLALTGEKPEHFPQESSRGPRGKQPEEKEEEEEEEFRFQFKFCYQNPESLIVNGEEEKTRIESRGGIATAAIVDNYRFMPERGLRGFVREPEDRSFHVEESYVGDGDSGESWALSSSEKIDVELRERFKSVRALQRSDSEEEERLEMWEQPESVCSCEWQEATNEELGVEDADDSTEGIVVKGDVGMWSCGDLDGLRSLESPSGSDGYTVNDLFLVYASEDIISDREPDDAVCGEYDQEALKNPSIRGHLSSGSEIESDMEKGCNSEEVGQLAEEFKNRSWGSDVGGSSNLNENQSCHLNDDSDVEGSEGDEGILAESFDFESLAPRGVGDLGEENLRELKHIMNDISLRYEIFQEDLKAFNMKSLVESDEEVEEEFCQMSRDMDLKTEGEEETFAVRGLKTFMDSDSDVDEEEDELESLWEHQDLIEQLKMEIKKVKETRLPTILEESEIKAEDLKAWKIDAKFLLESPMDELHKFYKTYRERMRKFDILNLQKMYTIEFLQLKDPFQHVGLAKLTIASLFAESLWPCRRRKSKNDPTEKFIRELQHDLETVYVGQLCLSWEFLWWQYERFSNLPKSDSHGYRQHNQVAGEFQQFQVIIQRFLEDDPFQGARVPHYVKTRKSLRTLLQVPFVKEDSRKGKTDDEKRGSKVITNEELIYIMERSIKILWHFIKSDKDETPFIIKGLARNRTELQDPTDRELMTEIQANLHKKERKLKDLLKVGNCLVKKFKKPQEQRLSKDLFCSQVDIKLVSRVLDMSRITTEQLLWCHMKLDKITFSDWTLHRESSFLLFPC